MGNTHYKRWVIPYLIFLLVAMALALFLPAFAIGRQWLPRWLWWFQTPDNDLDGDEPWKTKHVQWLRNGSYLKRVL